VNNVSTLEDITERKQEALRDRRARKRQRSDRWQEIPKAPPKLSDCLPPLSELDELYVRKQPPATMNGQRRSLRKTARVQPNELDRLRRKLERLRNEYDILKNNHEELRQYVSELPEQYRLNVRKNRYRRKLKKSTKSRIGVR
jgi:chromosome segregation ATPase